MGSQGSGATTVSVVVRGWTTAPRARGERGWNGRWWRPVGPSPHRAARSARAL